MSNARFICVFRTLRSNRFSRMHTTVLLLSLAALLTGLPLLGQGNAGRLLGAVTDESGGAISGARVAITDTQRGISRILATDVAGVYDAPNLAPGSYSLRASASGFKSVDRENVLLENGAEIRVDARLEPGEISEVVTVLADTPLVESTNGELGGVVPNWAFGELPLNGRNFMSLLQIRPGFVTYPGGSGSWFQSANGMRPHDNVYMVDGINTDDPWTAQPMVNATLLFGDAGTLLSVDSIDEVKIEQNPRAEYGWKPGAIVNVGIKSGTNAYHGSAFAFGRDGSWDALNYFASAIPPSQIPPVALEQFGASLGGPVKKDTLFYFLNFEDQRYSIGSISVVTTPVTAAGIGSSSTNLLLACQAALDVGTPAEAAAGTAGALTALSAQMAGIFVGAPSVGHANGTCVAGSNYPGLFPVNMGIGGAGQGSTAITESFADTSHIDFGLAKVTYHPTDKNSIDGSYYISPGNGILNDQPGSQTNAVWLTNQYARVQAGAGGWAWIPNAHWVNEARVGYSHYYQAFLSQDHDQDPANYNFQGTTYHIYSGQTNPLYFGLPRITIGAFTGALGADWPKYLMPDSVWDVLDHISYLHGRHSLKFGGEILDNASTSDITGNAKGPLRFDRLQDFFNGFPNGTPHCAVCPHGGNAKIFVGSELRHFRYEGYAGFFQDDWRVKGRFTANLGIRYEINTVPKERDNLQGNFAPNTTSGFAQPGVRETAPYRGNYNNFSPRIGFAWDLFGNGKTVLRAGAGIVYEQLSLDVAAGIGNSFGLLAQPTGALLCANGSCAPGPGTINVASVAYVGTPVINGTAPGDIPYNWAHNGPTTPLYSFVAACGDGNTTSPALPPGFKPTQCDAFLVDPNLRTPYVTSWNIDLQRALTNGLLLDVAYVGNHGSKMLSMLDINQPIALAANVPGIGLMTFGPGYTATGLAICAASPSLDNCAVDAAAEQAGRPYNTRFPYLSFIDDLGNFDTANYNSLQVEVTGRNYHGLMLLAGYTYSHALADASDQGLGGSNFVPINSYGNLRAQLYGPTSFDTRHRFTVSASYDIPGRRSMFQILQGWAINSVAVIQTGMPWNIGDSTDDFAGTGEQIGNAANNQGSQWNFFGKPSDFTPTHGFVGVTIPTGSYNVCNATVTSDCVYSGPGIPYFPGTTDLTSAPTANSTCNEHASNMGQLAVASLRILGCYGLGKSVLIPPTFGGYGTTQWNPFSGGGFRNWDLSVTKLFKFGERWSAQFRVEAFNVLNHPNFANPYSLAAVSDPSQAAQSQGLGASTSTPDVANSNPVLGSGGARDIQLGVKLMF